MPSSSEDPIIRFATEDDVPTILSLIFELAEYEKETASVEATEESLRRTLSFHSNPAAGFAKTLLVFPPADADDATPPCAGMALYFYNYSTWRAAPGIYLEDLFVRPAARGRGYGRALLRRLAQETLAAGGRRLEWSVLKWNEPSIRFYRGVGARSLDEWMGMRVDGAALESLALGPAFER